MMPRHMAVMAMLAALAAPASDAATYEFTVLHTFYNHTSPVSAPEGTTPTGFAIDADGNLFGTNRAGGAAYDGSDVTNNGTLWMLPSGGDELVVLHSFTNGADGKRPSSVLVDANGDLYGTTQGDANYVTPGRWGTVWRLPSNSGAVTAIHTFDGNVDGSNPWGIALDADGILHVTTQYGPVANGPGALFRLNKLGGGATSVEFSYDTTGTAGVYLTFDADGNAFGVSTSGGAGLHGTVFELPHASGALGALYAFAGGDDGKQPRGRLAIDDEGNLFGVTLSGGENGFGTVFELPNGATSVTTLYAFTGGADGRNPAAGVTIDSAGNLFGTTTAGGAHGFGTVFVLPRDASVPTTLHDLSLQDGVYPDAPLEIDADGNLFGTTTSGGVSAGPGQVAQGTIFRLHPVSSNELVFAQPPTNVAANAVISPAVVVHETDINGVIVPTFDGDVTLSIASGPSAATLSGTVTVAAAGGIATFADLRIDLDGTYALEATDGTLTATSVPFQVPEPDGAGATALASLAVAATRRRLRAVRDEGGRPAASRRTAMRALRLCRAVASSLLAAVFACSTGTPYAQYAASPPALAPGNGRIVLYMTTQQGDFRVALSLDGEALGTIEPATFFYVDRPAGTHVVTLSPPPHVDTFSQQAPTAPVTVELAAGAIAYVEVSVVWTPGQITAVLAPADAGDAQSDLVKLDLVPPR